MRAVWRPTHPPPSLLGQVSQPLSPVARNDASHTGSSRQHRAQDWSVNRSVVSRSRTFVRRLQTSTGAAPRRLLRRPHLVVQKWLLHGAIFHTVKGRTPNSSLEYLEAGTRLVWVIWPRWQEVNLWRVGDDTPTTLTVADELDGEDVVPGFTYPVADLFR